MPFPNEHFYGILNIFSKFLAFLTSKCLHLIFQVKLIYQKCCKFMQRMFKNVLNNSLNMLFFRKQMGNEKCSFKIRITSQCRTSLFFGRIQVQTNFNDEIALRIGHHSHNPFQIIAHFFPLQA